MSNKIKLSETEIDNLLKTMKLQLAEHTAKSDNFTINYTMPKVNNKADLIISTKAYTKIIRYIKYADKEIAWHGKVIKQGLGKYLLEDVFLYPQTVSGTTVTTDDIEYADWLNSLPDEDFNKVRYQGHSHVNMAASPSGVDLDYYDTLLASLQPTDFYIFHIRNKADTNYVLIYDLEDNLFYENVDITVLIEDVDDVVEMVNKYVKNYAAKTTISDKKETPVNSAIIKYNKKQKVKDENDEELCYLDNEVYNRFCKYDDLSGD